MARQSRLGPNRERLLAGVKSLQVRRRPVFLNVTPDSLPPPQMSEEPVSEWLFELDPVNEGIVTGFGRRCGQNQGFLGELPFDGFVTPKHFD